MTLFSYVVRYDVGFAPNPFSGWCTLACCKPDIRKDACVGDLIVGTSSTANGAESRLLYIMRVSEVIDFDRYWSDEQFKNKKPNLRGSRKQLFGDNIYHRHPCSGPWIQEDSRHSNSDGSPHCKHIAKDTKKTENVLISEDFVYWGEKAIKIPSWLRRNRYDDDIVKEGQGKRCKFHPSFIACFNAWFDNLENKGVLGRPTDWSKPF